MKVYENKKWGMEQRRIVVDMSTKFTYVSKKETNYIRFANAKWLSTVRAKKAESISVNYNKNSSCIHIHGNNMPFSISTDSVLAEVSYIFIASTGTNVEMKNSKKGKGLCDLPKSG